MIRAILMGLAAAVVAPPAAAEVPDGPHPAIGRLNHAGFRTRQHCTVSLIGPRTALTAAHCARGMPAAELHVVLGYDRGDHAEHLGVRAVQAAADADIARLCLDGPAKAPPLPVGAAAPGPVTIIGYPRSRAHVQRRRSCAATGRDGARVLIGCAVEPGMSGAPVLSEGRVVGAMSAAAARTSVAIPLSALPPGGCDAPG